MFRNYLVTALRNVTRHKLYSFINIAGLAVGLSCAIFIVLFLRDELSYDKWIPGTENVYRVESTFSFPGAPLLSMAGVPNPVTAAMKAQIPEVQAQTRLVPQRMTVKIGDRLFSERVMVVDPNFFQMIRLPLVEGDPSAVFAQPESLVISQTAARKYFGPADPVGRLVTIDATHTLKVTGILKDLPHNTQLVVDSAIPNTSTAFAMSQGDRADWLELAGYGYVRLAPGADPDAVLSKLPAILDRNIDTKRDLNADVRGSHILQLQMTRFRDVHLTPQPDMGGMTPAGSRRTVYGFAIIAALIVLIACFNFMNLATARAMMRAREVGLRKAMGAERRQLIAQFLGESVLTALLALVLALALVEILLPAFDGFLGRPISFHYIADWPLTFGIFSTAVVAGLLSGVYPALVLSGFRPALTLKSNSSGQSGSGVLRSGLVVMQFTISIGLGIAALVVFAQIEYARTLDLGFDRDNIVVLFEPDPLNNGPKPLSIPARDSLARALASDPAIADVAQSDGDGVPFEGQESSPARIPGNPQHFTISPIDIAPEFPRTYRMRLLAGRFLSRDRGTDLHHTDFLQDGNNVVINATAARMFGFTPSHALGTVIRVAGTRVTIVGVLQDALFRAAQTAPMATVYYFNPRLFDIISIRVKSGRAPEALAFIDSTWRRFAPTMAVRRRFLNESFDELLAGDEQQGAMFGIFVAIAIFIACLGLFGLAAFNSERRTREIGVRKVFGARTRDIVRLLLWQFSIPVLIANAIAWPVAWYYLDHWLEGYAYRIALNPLYFAGVGLAALLIAWATVIGHAVRVARCNPVHALRYE